MGVISSQAIAKPMLICDAVHTVSRYQYCPRSAFEGAKEVWAQRMRLTIDRRRRSITEEEVLDFRHLVCGKEEKRYTDYKCLDYPGKKDVRPSRLFGALFSR